MTESTPLPRRSQKLYKDPVDKKIAGVASGVAKYFDVDTTLVRAVWAVTALMGGFGILLYLVLWFILDDDPAAFTEAAAAPAAPAAAPTTTNAEDAEALAEAEAEIDTETFEADLGDTSGQTGEEASKDD